VGEPRSLGINASSATEGVYEVPIGGGAISITGKDVSRLMRLQKWENSRDFRGLKEKGGRPFKRGKIEEGFFSPLGVKKRGLLGKRTALKGMLKKERRRRCGWMYLRKAGAERIGKSTISKWGQISWGGSFEKRVSREDCDYNYL